MPTPPLSNDERARRKALVEQYLQQGYGPLGTNEGLGSATEAAGRDDGRITSFYRKWVRSEERFRERGEAHFVPDWSLYRPTTPTAQATTAGEPEVVLTALDHAQARAKRLSGEITDLLTRSRYPVVNPDAVIVDSYMVERYDRATSGYAMRESSPRTWLTDTLRVAPISDPRGRKFLFSGAQNDAPLDVDFWENLQAYAAYLGAEIAIGPWTYETQWWSENNPLSRTYDDDLSEHLCFGQLQIGDNFVFCGEMNTLPTASAPISDLTTYSRSKWAVFPHAKRQLKSVPSTDPNVQAHMVMTTGSVTKPKVIPRKAGVRSIFHQVIGAVLVEFDQDANVFCRQITAAKDGSFYDLDRHIKDGVVSTGHRARALVCGDLHLRKLDNANAMATFGFDMSESSTRYRDSVIDALRPEHVMLHDVFDNEARNHHHAGDSAYSYEMAIRGRDSVLDEIRGVARFLDKIERPDLEVIVVESNHDLGLERYVKEGRYRNDGVNVMTGLLLETAYLRHRERLAAALDAGKTPPSFSLLEHAVRSIRPHLEASWVHDGKSLLIDGIEVGHHGFRGANGAKGTVSGFARVGRRMTIGDKHSPEINEGVYVAGAMNLQMGYNKGPSSWAVSHVVQYPDGHRSLITLQRGKWRAEKPRVTVQASSVSA